MEREKLEVDVLFVGAGPASLASALHLSRLIREHNEAVESGAKSGGKLSDPTLLVIEKGREIGSHALSGAIIDPRAFDELLEGFNGEEPPYDSPVDDDALYILSKNKSFRSPVTPPPLRNHGYYVASLGKIVKWLAALCEKNGIDVYPEFPAVELLYEGDSVVGVRMGDKGIDKNGNPKPNVEPGMDVLAKLTVLGEGPRGTLTLQAERRFRLNEGRHPQIYAIGVKEIWRAAREVQPGVVYHTLGFPLGTQDFGGGFVYTMKDNPDRLGYCRRLGLRESPAGWASDLPTVQDPSLHPGNAEGRRGSFLRWPRPFQKEDITRCRGSMPTACSSWVTREDS